MDDSLVPLCVGDVICYRDEVFEIKWSPGGGGARPALAPGCTVEVR